jgi:hypothetical protein
VERDTMHLMLARWVLEVRAAPDELASALALRYAGFTCPPASPPDLIVEVKNELPAAPGTDESDSILQAELVGDGDKYLLDGPQFYGMIDPSRGMAELRLRCGQPLREFEYFLRIALAFFALRRDGLLLHCAALKRASILDPDGGGEVYLFVGQSGSGKSTVVSLSQAAGRAAALGDDLILLRPQDGDWCAYGTPFWNFDAIARDGEAHAGRVAGIYKLVQDLTVYSEAMGRAAATAELLANSPIVNDQPSLLPVLFDRCRDIVGAIGVRRLHFRKDDAFWDVITEGAPC